MSLDSEYLAETYTNVRARRIGWEAAVRGGAVTEEQSQRIKAVDRIPRSQRKEVVERESAVYAEVVRDVLRSSQEKNKTDVVQYMLVWTADILADVPSFTNALLSLSNPYDQFLTLLRGSHNDDQTPALAAAVLTTLLSSPAAKNSEGALTSFLHYLANVLSQGSEYHLQDLAVQSYVALLRRQEAKPIFWGIRSETIAPLVKILTASATGRGGDGGRNGIVQGGVPLQLLYHVLLVFWELSFEEDIAEELNPEYDLTPTITSILRSSIKEKITRVCLALLTNLINKSPSTNLPPLLLSSILPLLQRQAASSTEKSDPDMAADRDTLIAALEEFQAQQTTLSSYRMEVLSGHLRWSPPHRNQNFWKKHAQEILDDAEVIKKLGDILHTSNDKTSLAVAANDIGVLVREIPYARKRWEENGIKARVMTLMVDDDAEVRYEALQAVEGFLRTAFRG